jgi:hypothetical protein
MTLRPGTPRAAALLVAAALLATAPTARADETPPPRVQEATEKFAAGERAFRNGEYVNAAILFQQAHSAVPHHDAAWNAAQAWLKAGDVPRAVDWLEIFLAEAPAEAPDRREATAKLGELSPRLGRVEVRPEGAERVKIDDEPARAPSPRVLAGTHAVEAIVAGRPMRRSVVVHPGETTVVDFSPPAEPAKPPPRRVLETPAPAPSKGWSPLVVVGGGIVTSGLAAVTIVFGLATQRAHDDYATAPTAENWENGRQKQDLTNGFFWGTVAAGAVTGAIALFFVDWNRPLATQRRPGITF